MPGRYVVAVKGPGHAGAAHTWATDHAAAAGAPLLAVHVVGEAAPASAARAAEPPPRDRDTATLQGPINPALASFVNEDDVLVLGTDKTGFLHSRVLGVRGLQIASVVSSSVAVIPDVDLRFRSGVVAGIDREGTAAGVAYAAAAEAAALSQPLQLIHSSFTGGSTTGVDARTVLTVARSSVERRWPDLAVRTRMTARPPAEALLDASRNATLLVVGPGRAPVDTPFASVVHDVLININAPVLIARPPRASS